jgi:hypothetical protein
MRARTGREKAVVAAGAEGEAGEVNSEVIMRNVLWDGASNKH